MPAAPADTGCLLLDFCTLLLGAEITSIWLWANQENQKLPSVPSVLLALCPSAFLPRPPPAQGDIAEEGIPLLMAELVPLSLFGRVWGHFHRHHFPGKARVFSENRTGCAHPPDFTWAVWLCCKLLGKLQGDFWGKSKLRHCWAL